MLARNIRIAIVILLYFSAAYVGWHTPLPNVDWRLHILANHVTTIAGDPNGLTTFILVIAGFIASYELNEFDERQKRKRADLLNSFNDK